MGYVIRHIESIEGKVHVKVNEYGSVDGRNDAISIDPLTVGQAEGLLAKLQSAINTATDQLNELETIRIGSLHERRSKLLAELGELDRELKGKPKPVRKRAKAKSTKTK